MRTLHTPVLVVGAGLGGLSTAMFLGLHGVGSVVVERHPGTSTQPKARGQMPAVMEALRVVGAADRFVAANPPGRPEMTIVIAESVTGRVLHSFTEAMPDFTRYSPEPVGMVSQERAEPILADRARELGADIRFSSRMESFADGSDGVTALIRDLTSDETYQITADYLVGADGHKGTIRDTAGIGWHGRGELEPTTFVVFEADLDVVLDGSAVQMHYIQNSALPGGSGTFVSTDVPGRWGAGFKLLENEVTEDEIVGMLRVITGIDDLAAKILDVNSFNIALRVADKFSAGHVHLVGDAARVVPPTGGQGGNTAVLDGYHLAWKLAAVHHGHAGPGLLASHDAERRPYSDFLAEQQYANLVQRLMPHLADDTVADVVDPARGLFGYYFAEGAFHTEPGNTDQFDDPDHPSGRPGTRAPHVPLTRNGSALSTRELYGRSTVLLAGPDGADWATAAERAATELGVPIEVHRLGADGLDAAPGAWSTAHGVPDSGAVLVRPDGLIAWRSTDSATPADLEPAIRTLFDR